jgi:hypothetical protein
MKNKETLEEAAYNTYMSGLFSTKTAFIQGAKWQQENSNANALNFEIDALKREIEVLKHNQDSNFTVKYIKSEMEFQIERMAKLGINTTGQCFEQMVTSLILLAERSYSEEEVLNILYKHTEDLLAGKKLTLEEWFEQFKKK